MHMEESSQCVRPEYSTSAGDMWQSSFQNSGKNLIVMPLASEIVRSAKNTMYGTALVVSRPGEYVRRTRPVSEGALESTPDSPHTTSRQAPVQSESGAANQPPPLLWACAGRNSMLCAPRRRGMIDTI